MRALVSYQDTDPPPALLRSYEIVHPRAAELLNLEYFDADPARMPHEIFTQHTSPQPSRRADA
ncbi:MAG: hypothetical protein ACKVS5_15275 [Parvularculaceae bacterium]